jgi:tetratricopeptide (TPR) repeat protein
LPLAIELAAARIRLLDPDALLRRLARSLDALGTGTTDMPERQRTLRATVEWSVGLLEEDERLLLEALAVFVDGWNLQAAALVAELDEEQALELLEALARHSLVQLDSADDGPRMRMLETIREFVAERLAVRPDVGGIGRRHADYYRALAEQADRPLRGVGQIEWAQRLQADAGNLAAAVRWYLAHDPRPLPHLFRVLVLFWSLGNHMSEAKAWIDQLLPTADSLGHQARAELLWTAAVNATEVGDDATALSARERLVPLLVGIGDSYLHAVCRFAIAGLSAILGDMEGALRVALTCLDELRGQNEPFWTALAAFTVGSMETALGRYDDALRHLREVRDLAERLDNAWLAAWSAVQVGTLAVMRGRLDEARAILDEAIDLSLGTRNTRTVTMCLAAFGRLAFVEGDAERAALLVGAADGLRRRVGLRAWPMLRRGGAELGAQIREALGSDRFGVRCRRPAEPAGSGDRRAGPARRLNQGADRSVFTRLAGLMVRGRDGRKPVGPRAARAHAAWFVGRAEAAEPELRWRDQLVLVRTRQRRPRQPAGRAAVAPRPWRGRARGAADGDAGLVSAAGRPRRGGSPLACGRARLAWAGTRPGARPGPVPAGLREQDAQPQRGRPSLEGGSSRPGAGGDKRCRVHADAGFGRGRQAPSGRTRGGRAAP